MTDEFDTEDARRRARSNYRTGAVFCALVNAIRAGVDDDTELLKVAEEAERKFDCASQVKVCV